MKLAPGICCYLDAADAPLELIDIVIAWSIPAALLPRLPGLKWIQSTGAGVDQFLSVPDLPASVSITRVGVNSGHVPGMAEYALTAILATCKHLREYTGAQVSALWKPKVPVLLNSICVGVIGLGHIGKSVVSILKRVGITVRGLRRNPKPCCIDGVPVYACEQLPEFLDGLDFIVLAVPLTPQTSRMLAMEQFMKMKPTAWIINMSRGGVIDDADLISALDRNILAGAVLDTFNTEPLPREHPFWLHPRIVITPHVSGEIVVGEAAAEFAENLQRFRLGEPMHFLVSREKGY